MASYLACAYAVSEQGIGNVAKRFQPRSGQQREDGRIRVAPVTGPAAAAVLVSVPQTSRVRGDGDRASFRLEAQRGRGGVLLWWERSVCREVGLG